VDVRPDEAGAEVKVSSALPSGTLTFLFTDVEDSTLLWERDEIAMRGAVSAAAELLAASIRAHGGHVVKSTGDGLMAVFVDAAAAVGAAVDAQRSLTASTAPVPLAIRMGLHSGSAEPVDGDYLAPSVNRAARVAATAHPGQILVSDAVAVLADGVSLVDLGEHQMKGLAPMRLHQVVAEGLRRDFPPTAAATLTGLPTQTTSFIGRTAEVEAVGDLLGSHRLVTITGAGGCGKTRLAIEVARRYGHVFRDGARFVDLAATSDASVVDEAIADALGLSAGVRSVEPRDRLVSYLAAHDLLIVLDNCEHLVDACASVVGALLGRDGSSRVLATSREPLALVGEHVVTVPSMDAETEAARLFADRAADVRAGFVVDEPGRNAVTQICRRLDGIPLAIELAAARVAVLAPEQILDRLDDRFRLLTGGHRRIARQATLEATLDWSYSLLDDRDRMALRHLAVFPASFTLGAAEHVLSDDDALERLASLVAKSLVQLVDGPDGIRYRLLETVRVYAESKLLADSNEVVRARTRHRDWMRDWLLSIPLGERWVGDNDVLATWLPSVRSSLEWSVDHDELDVAAEIAAGVDWTRTESYTEGIRWGLRVLEAVPVELQIELYLMMWWIAPLYPDNLQKNSSKHALDLARSIDSDLLPLAYAASARDLIIPAADRRDERLRARSIELAETAVLRSAGMAEPWPMLCRMLAGMVYSSFRMPEPAAAHFAAGSADPPAAPYLDLHATLRAYEAVSALAAGDAARAATLARGSYKPDGLVPYWQHARAVSLVALGATGDVATAEQALLDYDAAARRVDWVFTAESVVLLAGVLAGLREDWERSSLLLAASVAVVYRSPADVALYFSFRDRARAALGSRRSQELRAAGRALRLEEARRVALEG
jgi:predicted ATPase/class 3 adenylate cyclase